MATFRPHGMPNGERVLYDLSVRFPMELAHMGNPDGGRPVQKTSSWRGTASSTQLARFVHISAIERAGLHSLNEGQKVSFDVVADRRSGKSSADNLRAA